MSSIKITVIIPTFNGKSRGYLLDTLNSVLSQNHIPDEIIVVNDGSTDSTLSFLHTYNNIRIIDKPSGGVSSARNLGILNATHDWIAFLDDDDIWDVDKLEKQVLQIENTLFSDNVIFASKMRIFKNNDINDFFNVTPPYIFCSWPECLVGCPISGPSGVIVNKAIFNQIGLFNIDISIGEDYEFWCRCLKSGIRIEYSNSILFSYRFHQMQATSLKTYAETLLKSTNAVMPLIKQNTPNSLNKILAVRFLIGIRSLILKSNISQVAKYYKEAYRPTLKHFYFPFLYIFFDSMYLILKCNSFIISKEKYFKKLIN